MTIKLINRGEEGELLLCGRLDTTTAPEVDEVFDQVAERFNTVVLNLVDLEYTSSVGLRSIKRLYMAMKKKGGNLYLKNANATVMEVFEITGFASLLRFI